MTRDEAEAQAQALMDAFWYAGMSEHELRDGIAEGFFNAVESERSECERAARCAGPRGSSAWIAADAIASRRSPE